MFGWVLAGRTSSLAPNNLTIASHHVSTTSCNDFLHKFWEVEENPKHRSSLSPEESFGVQHFDDNHSSSESGRFIVPLPKKPQSKPLGGSRSQAVRRFMSLECSLHSNFQFPEFSAIMEEYFEMGHAELVPIADLHKPPRCLLSPNACCQEGTRHYHYQGQSSI